MNSRNLRLLAIVGMSVGLTACAATTNMLEQPGDAKFGEANRQTMMAQVIDPDPQYDKPAVTSGEVGEQAVTRYREGKVTKPATQTTTSGSSSTGSSGPN